MELFLTLLCFFIIISSPHVAQILKLIKTNPSMNLLLKKLLDKKMKIKFTIEGLRSLYESNGKPSNYKIAIITFILNLNFGVVMYYSAISDVNNTMYSLKSIPFFILVGSILMFYFEKKSYKTFLPYLKEYSINENQNILLKGFLQITYKVLLKPLFLLFIPVLFLGAIFGNNVTSIYLLIPTLFIYFSPLAPIAFVFGIFPLSFEIKLPILLSISIISIYIPIIYLFIMKYYYKFFIIINHFILKYIPFAINCRKNPNENNNFLCILLLILVFIFLEAYPLYLLFQSLGSPS